MFTEINSKFNARILVVDDYPLGREFAKEVLEQMNCRVDIAEDGEQALEMFRTNNYDLVFMDVRMPKIDGYEVTRRIRAVEESPKRIPIIALTANALQGDEEKCIKAGMDDYIAKPFEGIELETILKTYIADLELEPG